MYLGIMMTSESCMMSMWIRWEVLVLFDCLQLYTMQCSCEQQFVATVVDESSLWKTCS